MIVFSRENRIDQCIAADLKSNAVVTPSPRAASRVSPHRDLVQLRHQDPDFTLGSVAEKPVNEASQCAMHV